MQRAARGCGDRAGRRSSSARRPASGAWSDGSTRWHRLLTDPLAFDVAELDALGACGARCRGRAADGPGRVRRRRRDGLALLMRAHGGGRSAAGRPPSAERAVLSPTAVPPVALDALGGDWSASPRWPGRCLDGRPGRPRPMAPARRAGPPRRRCSHRRAPAPCWPSGSSCGAGSMPTPPRPAGSAASRTQLLESSSARPRPSLQRPLDLGGGGGGPAATRRPCRAGRRASRAGAMRCAARRMPRRDPRRLLRRLRDGAPPARARTQRHGSLAHRRGHRVRRRPPAPSRRGRARAPAPTGGVGLGAARSPPPAPPGRRAGRGPAGAGQGPGDRRDGRTPRGRAPAVLRRVQRARRPQPGRHGPGARRASAAAAAIRSRSWPSCRPASSSPASTRWRAASPTAGWAGSTWLGTGRWPTGGWS